MAARVAVLAVLVALAAAAPAQARFVLGIGDQSTAMLDDARFTALGLTDTRIVVPYDVATDPVQLARYAPFLDAAHARGIRVLVAFGARRRLDAPAVACARTRRAVRAFRARFPWVRDLGDVERGQPRLAADGAPPGPGGAALQRPARRVPRLPDRRRGRPRPGWLRDAGSGRSAAPPAGRGSGACTTTSTSTATATSPSRACAAATGGRGQVWLTETGGVVRFARSFGYDERRAARSTRHVLRIAARRNVRRVYLYQWTGAPLGARWDSGLVAADGRARPALNVVEPTCASR